MGEVEVYLVGDREVALTADMHPTCDGGNGPLGHPMEFLTLEHGGRARCKYCDRLYVLASGPQAQEVRAHGIPQAA